MLNLLVVRAFLIRCSSMLELFRTLCSGNKAEETFCLKRNNKQYFCMSIPSSSFNTIVFVIDPSIPSITYDNFFLEHIRPTPFCKPCKLQSGPPDQHLGGVRG